MTTFPLIIFGAALCYAVSMSLRLWGCRGLIAFATMLMVILPVVAQVPVEFIGMTTNFGNILYAPVIYASVLYSRRDECPWRLVQIIMAACVSSAVLIIIAANLDSSVSMDALRRGSIAVAAASLVAFVFANAVAFRFAAHPVVAQVLAQVMDSLIFFALASIIGMKLGEAMLGGFLLKSAIVLTTWLIPEPKGEA